MARRAIVQAVMVLTRELVVDFESDEHLQAQIVEQLQGDGLHGWNRQAFTQQECWVEIAEVVVEMKDTLPQQRQIAG